MKAMKKLLPIITALVILSGCSTTRYVEVPRVHTEYVRTVDTLLHRDSIYTHDSVFVSVKGDTVSVERWHTRWRDRIIRSVHTDTVMRTDTVTKVIAVGKPKTSVFAKAADKLDCFFSSVLKLAGIIMLLYGLLWTAVKTDYINRLIQWIRKLWK